MVFMKHYKLNSCDSSMFYINGWEYQSVPAGEGHPFLIEKAWREGVVYSKLNPRVESFLNYDIYRDELVIQTFIDKKMYQIALNPLYINKFQLDDRNFINPSAINFPQHKSLNGYYELLVDEKIKFIVKWRKSLVDTDDFTGDRYELTSKGLLLYSGKILELRNKRSLYKFFPEYKREISSYLRNRQIYIKSADNDQLGSLVRYINSQISD